MNVEIDLCLIYHRVSGSVAKLSDMNSYITEVLSLAGVGNRVNLTGSAPIWMYLKIAHALHGKAKRLTYSAPGQGIEELEIFNHDPFQG